MLHARMITLEHDKPLPGKYVTVQHLDGTTARVWGIDATALLMASVPVEQIGDNIIDFKKAKSRRRKGLPMFPLFDMF